MTLTPQAILGDPITGIGAEPFRSSLAKYNAHIHALVNPFNFLQSGIKLGDSLTAENLCGITVLPSNTVVTIITPTSITLNNNATRTDNCRLAINVNQLFLDNVSSTIGSPVLTITNQNSAGFISSNSFKNLSTFVLSGFLQTVETGFKPLLLKAPFSCYLVGANFIAEGGKVNVSVEFKSNTYTFVKRIDLGDCNNNSLVTHDLTLQNSVRNSLLNVNQSIGILINTVETNTNFTYTLVFAKVV